MVVNRRWSGETVPFFMLCCLPPEWLRSIHFTADSLKDKQHGWHSSHHQYTVYDPASTYMSHHQCMWSTIAFFSILNGLKHDYKLGPAQDSVELHGVGRHSHDIWSVKTHDVVVVLKVDQHWRWEVFLRVESTDPLAPLCGEVPANYTDNVFTSTFY